MFIFSILWVCLSNSFVESKLKLDNLVPTCSLNDVNVEECIRLSGNKLLPILSKGIRDWGVIGLDPITIPNILIGQDTGPISLTWKHINTTITEYGLCNITKLKFDKLGDNYNFVMNITTRNFSMIGNYRARGKMLFFPIRNEGHEEVHSGPAKLDMTMLTKPEKRNKIEYLKIVKYSLSFTFNPKKIYVVLVSNAEKPTQLDKVLSKFINENTQEIIQEMKSTFDEAFGALIRQYIQALLNKIPLKDLFKQ